MVTLLANVPPPVIGWSGIALAAVALLFALRAGKRKRLIDDIPTSKTSGVFIGLVELKGTAESEGPLRSYLAEIPCVEFSWSVQEHWSRTRTETYTDSEGKTKTRTKRESGWKTVADGNEQSLFYLQDDCGVIRVDPERAKIQGDRVFSETCGRSDPLYYDKGPAGAVMDSDHRRRFTETAIPLHADLYVMGRSRLREDVVAPEIAHDVDAPMFLISTRSEEQISSGLNWQFRLLGVLAVILGVAGWAVRDHVADVDPRGQIASYLGVAAAVLGGWAVGWVWMVYNSMVHLRQRVRQGWSNVDVQLKRRADLIPGLVKIVQGYSDHEQAVHEQIALLRSQASVTAPGEGGPDPRGCAPQLVAIREAYPDLKANQSFLDLQEQLVDTEQRIALARSYFNEIAGFYNMRLQVIPDRFVCSLARLTPQPYITAEDFERATVKVNLSD